MKKAILPYMGGKSRLTKQILPMLPEHSCYVEVFAGAAWLFFRKPQSKVEILNDINNELITFYRVVRLHLPELLRYMETMPPVNRTGFRWLRDLSTDGLTDIQRAARYYWMQRSSFAGDGGISINTTERAFHIDRYRGELLEAADRMQQAYIDCLPFRTAISRYDREHVFFYLDPPYWGFETCYGKGVFARSDFGVLADILSGIRGKFLLSINDTPEIRELFGRFNVIEVETVYSAGNKSGRSKGAKELLISNF